MHREGLKGYYGLIRTLLYSWGFLTLCIVPLELKGCDKVGDTTHKTLTCLTAGTINFFFHYPIIMIIMISTLTMLNYGENKG